MQTEQLNLRVPSALADRLRSDAFDRKILPRDVVVELLETRYGPQPPEPIDGQLSVEQLTVDETQTETPAILKDSRLSESASRRPRAARKAERSTGSTPESSETVNATGSFPSGDEDGRRDREALVPVVDRSEAQEAPIPGGAPEPVEAGTPAGCPECGGEMAGRTDDGRTVCDDCGWAAE